MRILFFLCVIPISIFGQKDLESSLISSLLNYEHSKKNYSNNDKEEKKALQIFTSILEKAITTGEIKKYDNFKQNVDTLNYKLTSYISENKDIKLYQLSNKSMYHWNYLQFAS
ncbi:hypothetical protein [Soonwooa buanensis]|nr:hypothetical protein [Soonwooa buanensis]